MASGFSLADQLFNEESLGDLAAEYAAGVAGFDGARFLAEALGGMAGRGLLERLEWIADCIEAQLSPDFAVMAGQIEDAMPPMLDDGREDDDFGRFIHAVPGILAVRHGLEDHRERALDLIYVATKRFSMEYYIRPFLNRWPDQTLARLEIWVRDENYHVRRLVSEGTRPRLPWAKNIEIDPLEPLRFLDVLHADGTRYVTRSVANHLNDIAKIAPDEVLGRLRHWRDEGRQTEAEMAWMTRHALRTLVKQGHVGALALLGYRADVAVEAEVRVPERVAIGDVLEIAVRLSAKVDLPVLVDYVIWFRCANGREGRKVFKLKQGVVRGGKPLELKKNHRLMGNATTYRLVPGVHRVEVQVNGRILAQATFDLVAG